MCKLLLMLNSNHQQFILMVGQFYEVNPELVRGMDHIEVPVVPWLGKMLITDLYNHPFGCNFTLLLHKFVRYNICTLPYQINTVYSILFHYCSKRNAKDESTGYFGEICPGEELDSINSIVPFQQMIGGELW